MADRPPGRPARTVVVGVTAAIALIAVLLFLFIPLGGSEPESGREAGTDSLVVGGHPLLDQAAPEIDLLSLDGDEVRLSELRGRPVLINFWASWCPPCREEFPLLVAAYQEHAAEGLEILGVMHQDFADGARAFAQDMGAEWPILEDPKDVAYADYLVTGLPTSYFVDGNGVVRAFSLGGFSEAGLAAQLQTILPQAGHD